MTALADIHSALTAGRLIPYLGPNLLTLCPDYAVPGSPGVLAARLTAKASVPPKIRNNLSRSAQFIENFKHRKTLVALMDEAFSAPPAHSELHEALADLPLPLIVDSWYDEAMASALRSHRSEAWQQIQGLSQSEHFGRWTGVYDANGTPRDAVTPGQAVLYKPWGGLRPASNYLVSDTDFVEVLTEIDIQTPIPDIVQQLRSGRRFLFLGCRFDDQLTRAFARQIMKRSSDHHWAVLPDEPSRMESRFLSEQNITRIPMPLADFAKTLIRLITTTA